MKYLTRYLWMGAVIAIALVLKFQNVAGGMKEVAPFRGALVESEVFYPRMASSVNGRTITVSVDGGNVTSDRFPIYMDENLELLLPVTSLRDSFRCSAHVYGDELLRILKYTHQIEFTKDAGGYVKDGETVGDSAALSEHDGTLYVPARLVAESLGYDYSWSMEENTALLSGGAENGPIYPARFFLSEEGRSPTVRDQGSFDTCWAFATLSALESSLLPEEQSVFSANHMTLDNAFAAGQDDGGDYTMAMAYLLGWQGPVLEADDPYGSDTNGDLLHPVDHVQEIRIIDSKNLEGIKEAVFLYGGVETAIYCDFKNSRSDSPSYDRATQSYCYIGTEKPNHDVVIVGWDDDYPKENFTGELEGDGAFLCQNSWGTEFGDDGCFYISYYDTNIGVHNVVYTGVEDMDNYDRIAQTDHCGWVGQFGYGLENAFGANVYTAQDEETLSAIGFYATGKGSRYELSVVRDFSEKTDLSRREVVAEGDLGWAGYYTISLPEPITLSADERFAVVLEIRTPGEGRPLAVEYQADELTETVDLSDGEGYVSVNGHSWDSIEETNQCNLCLKAYLTRGGE